MANHRPGVAAALTVAVVLTGGCGSPGGPNAASTLAAGGSPTPGVGATAGPTCPSLTGSTGTPWPAAVPREIPTIPGAVLTGPVAQSQGITYVRFSTAQSLRDGVLYLLGALPSAGFTLGRGDSERTEADAPFASPALFGSVRLTLVDDCRTDWLLATRRRDASQGDAPVTPLIAPRTMAPGATPLPFG